MAQQKGISSSNKSRSGGSSSVASGTGGARSASTTWGENSPSGSSAYETPEDSTLWEMCGITPDRLDAVSRSLRGAKENADETLQKVQDYLDDQFVKAKAYSRENPGAVLGAVAGILTGAGLLTAAIRRDRSSKSRKSAPTLSQAGRKLQKASAKAQKSSTKKSSSSKKSSAKKASSKKKSSASKSKKAGSSSRKSSAKRSSRKSPARRSSAARPSAKKRSSSKRSSKRSR